MSWPIHPVLVLSLVGIACGGGDGKTTDGVSDTLTSTGVGTGTAGSSSTGSTGNTSGVSPTSGGGTDSNGGTSTGSTSTGTSTDTSTSTGSGTSTSTGTSTGGDTSTSSGSSSGSESSSGGPLCQGMGQSCAGIGALCCEGLECCVGNPVPMGKEFCSDECPKSDRNLKTDIIAVDAAEVLRRVVELPVATWRYRADGPEVRHLGPMAQDFRAAFGLWNTDTRIFPLDASGVSLAAIQGLYARVVAAESENAELRARLERLERRVAAR